ncbi:MAG: MerR family transcriptional regulator [Spirochaetales bacterium]|nr:MerR family transcriptional regulator [Spirochaetales bacterium]
MDFYSIGDACKLLGVKAHVLRYWEQEIPLLSPRKDPFGKRLYSRNDLNILFRIRYLTYEERYTLEGVKKRLWKEMDDGDLDWKSRIHEVRGETLKLYSLIREQKKEGHSLRTDDKDVDNQIDAENT